MPVLHRTQAHDAVKTAVVLDLGDLVAQGQRLRAAAKSEAGRIIAQGQSERARLIADASKEGHRQGVEKGLEEGRITGHAAGREAALVEHRKRLDELIGALTTALEAFERDRTALLDQARVDAIRLAIELASSIVRRVIAADPKVVVDQVAAILGTLSRPSRLTLRIHPDDLAAMSDAMSALKERFAHAAHAELLVDESLDRGSCVAETPAGGKIDASIKAQLDAVAAELLPS
ncbi:MAG: FliH/SctL family protein [Phycisphaerales bacterium]